MNTDDWEIGWRRIEVAEVRGNRWGIVPRGAWQGVGEFEWQIIHRERKPATSAGAEVPRRFELTCAELASLGGWFKAFGSQEEARAEAEQFESRARSRRQFLGTPGTRSVVLWPERWAILRSSQEITTEWQCPRCFSSLPAYQVEIAGDKSRQWLCSSCSMPLEWRESPERFHLSGIELDRLEAQDLQREWGVSSTVVGDRHFFIDDLVEASAVHSLRHVWLPSYLTSRTVLCCEEGSDGKARWVAFVTDQERLAILIEASESQETHLGYYVDFKSLAGMLDLKNVWDPESGWVDQLPNRQVFWFEQGEVRPDPEVDVVAISRLLADSGQGGER